MTTTANASTDHPATTRNGAHMTNGSNPAPTLTTEQDHVDYVAEAERAVSDLEQRILAGDESAGHDELAALLVAAEARVRFAELHLEGFRRRKVAQQQADLASAARELAADVQALAKDGTLREHPDSPPLARAVKTIGAAVRKYLGQLDDYSAHAGELMVRADDLGVARRDYSGDAEAQGAEFDNLYRDWRGAVVAPEGDLHWGVLVLGSEDRDKRVQELLRLVRAELPDQL